MQSAMLIRESPLQMPRFTHTIVVLLVSILDILEPGRRVLPAIGGKRMARMQRKRSGPSHMVSDWRCSFCVKRKENERIGGL
jgi:hypothetical protein